MFLDLEQTLTCVLPGIEVPADVAAFIFERIHWINEGEVEEFQAEPPKGWSLHDLCTLAFFVASKEHQLAKHLIQSASPVAQMCSRWWVVTKITR